MSEFFRRARHYINRMRGDTCPICKIAMPADWSEYPEYPFCTKRCQMVDLGRWLGEDYKVAGKAQDENRSTPGE